MNDLPDCTNSEIESCDHRYGGYCCYDGSFCAHKDSITIFSGVEISTYLKATARIKELEELLEKTLPYVRLNPALSHNIQEALKKTQ